MERDDALAFARSWEQAWNDHDLEAVLGHFADDAVFSSPIAAALLPETAGLLEGKDEIRRYWRIGLDRIPDLRFVVHEVFTGVDTVVIRYENQTGALVSEVLRFDGPLVVRGDGTYLVDDAAAASGARD